MVWTFSHNLIFNTIIHRHAHRPLYVRQSFTDIAFLGNSTLCQIDSENQLITGPEDPKWYDIQMIVNIM